MTREQKIVGTNVGTNEQRVLELIRMNSRITAKEITESLSISLIIDE